MQHRIRKENDLNHEKWIGIGGKFEDRETPEECVRREITEETGLTVGSLRYRGIITFLSDRWEGEYMHLFTTDDYTGDPYPECNEGTHVWVRKEEVCSLPIWEGDKLFFRLLDSDAGFFTMKLVYEGDELVAHEETVYG